MPEYYYITVFLFFIPFILITVLFLSRFSIFSSKNPNKIEIIPFSLKKPHIYAQIRVNEPLEPMFSTNGSNILHVTT